MIIIDNVYKTFNDHRSILNGVNLHIDKKETITIIGPSGCGKSTLLRLIIGLEKASSGKIYIDGQDTSTITEKDNNNLRMRFGFVFQSSALFDSLTVGENIAFRIQENFNISDKKIQNIIAEKLEMVGLPGLQNTMPAELSGGMQKRVSLARAIAHNPDIVLFDEPTTGLDPIMSTTIEDLIKRLSNELKITTIIVTHQLSTIFRCSQRIVMLNNGKIIEAGTPENIKQSKNDIVHNFINGKTNQHDKKNNRMRT